MSRTVLQRLHNPANLRCDCTPECWCNRSKIGYAVRWYVPGPFHRLRRHAPKAWQQPR